VIEASSSNDAVGQLRQSGYFPTSVVEEAKASCRQSHEAVAKQPRPSVRRGQRGAVVLLPKEDGEEPDPHDLHRQLATLIDAGLRCCARSPVLAKQERDPLLHKTINQLADAVQSGSTFSESMAQHR